MTFLVKLTLWPLRKAFNDTFMGAGGYDRQHGINAIAENEADLVHLIKNVVAYSSIFYSY